MQLQRQGVSVTEYGVRRTLIVVAVMLAALLETLDTTIVNVALPTIEGNIGASIEEGVWIITGYITANVVAIPLNPFLIRLLGRKRYFASCIAGFTVASFLCSTAHTLPMLVAFRILQGAFGGGLISTSQVVIRETLPPEKLGISSALFAIALVMGPALGPLVGGYLTDALSWQWIFDVNLLPGTLSTIIVVALLRDPTLPERLRIDWLGAMLLAVSLGSLQFLLDNGERRDWFDDAGIRYAALACIGGLASFIWWQWHGARSPIVDLHVFRYRSVRVGSLLGLSLGALIFGPAVTTPLYTTLVLNYTASQSGLLLVMRALPIIVLTPVFAKLAERGADVRHMLGCGFAIAAASLAWLQFSMTSGSPFVALAWPMFCTGIAQSMLLVPLIIGVLSTTPAALNTKVSPILTLSVQLGGSLGVAASVTVFDRRTAFHSDVLAGAITIRHLATLGLQPTAATIARLQHLVSLQANTLGFADTILALGALAVVAAPLVLAFPRSAMRASRALELE